MPERGRLCLAGFFLEKLVGDDDLAVFTVFTVLRGLNVSLPMAGLCLVCRPFHVLLLFALLFVEPFLSWRGERSQHAG